MTLQQRWRIGFDIGGTFTDFILYDGEKRSVRLHKRLTTPHDPSEAALIGLEELVAMGGIKLADVGEIVHGTTLVTNAVIERKGAKLGLVTTGGFRDILEMGTEQRYDIYDLFLEFPKPLAPRDLRLEVSERIDRDGQVVTALDQEDAPRAAPPRRGWLRGDRGLLPQRLPQSRARARRRPHRRRGDSRSCRSRSRATSSPRSGNTSAASPPAPTPMCSR